MPVILIVLDGFGIATDDSRSAIARARKPFIDLLFNSYAWTKLDASGEDVGLPDGQMGNSEVGHMNIGAGRVVYQEITRIDRSIRLGDFFKNTAFLGAVEQVKRNSSALHLIGLLSDGGVHSMNTHLYALLRLARDSGVDRVYIHALLDGRDTPPESGTGYIAELLGKCAEIGVGRIATVMGRFYAMDRDNRWERVERAYRAMTERSGIRAADPIAAVNASYARQESDEFVQPIVLEENGKPAATVSDGDAVIFFNFRADRAREITGAFIMPDFNRFTRRKLDLYYATMTQYHEDFTVPVAFPPSYLVHTLGEIISALGLKQLRIAETEKYAHVTFFFNGGREDPFPGEDRILVPSPKDVLTYDLKPEMSASEVTDRLIGALKTGKYSLVVLNYANCDMVGHSGIMEAAVKAVETVDACLAQLIPVALKNGFAALITADHGNADMMIDDDGKPHTAHTTNLVPFIVVKDGDHAALRPMGRLADIAPTILDLMNLPKPEEMDGESLFARTALETSAR